MNLTNAIMGRVTVGSNMNPTNDRAAPSQISGTKNQH
jgi:hypothetical protein